jgi:hypothetical protein
MLEQIEPLTATQDRDLREKVRKLLGEYTCSNLQILE